MGLRSLLKKFQANRDFLAFRPEELVTSAYQALLGQDPDPSNLRTYTDGIRNGRGLLWLLQSLVQSVEFILKHSGGNSPLDTAPPMDVQLHAANPEELRALWDHISSVWSKLGSTDPYWSVVTDERFRSKNMMDETSIEAFYATGQGDLLRLEAWLRRNALELDPNSICAEYGCGVGRLTHWLARRVRRVVAFDISEPHLKAAHDYLSRHGIHNVDLVLVREEADLQMLSEVDLFYSSVVLQHNPPPIMTDILSRAFGGLKNGGHCFFQIPTYSANYSFSMDTYWTYADAHQQMEMHFLPQKTVLELARRHEVFPLEIQPDAAIGNRTCWISNTFLMMKRLAPPS
jgi:2-polyprenyl-3-methyl-5-hydroxy-6-metoxy-1,4-benzoquinol methylase